MSAYLLTWNPDKWNWSNYERQYNQCAAGKRIRTWWSAGNRKSMPRGARVFLLRQSKDRGLIAAGYTISDVHESDHWDGSDRPGRSVRVEFETILPMSQVLATERLLETDLEVPWNYLQGSGVAVPSESARRLEAMWRRHLVELGQTPIWLAEEVPGAARYREGMLRKVSVNAYERNPRARQVCLEYYGTQCFVCEFDFGRVYGPIGQDFIHVHHRRDLASIGETYEVDPMADLVPVCPNCHAMLHMETPAMDVETLKEILQSRGLQDPGSRR